MRIDENGKLFPEGDEILVTMFANNRFDYIADVAPEVSDAGMDCDNKWYIWRKSPTEKYGYWQPFTNSGEEYLACMSRAKAATQITIDKWFKEDKV